MSCPATFMHFGCDVEEEGHEGPHCDKLRGAWSAPVELAHGVRVPENMVMTTAFFNQLLERIDALEDVVSGSRETRACGAPRQSGYDVWSCELLAGHSGLHRDDTGSTWGPA